MHLQIIDSAKKTFQMIKKKPWLLLASALVDVLLSFLFILASFFFIPLIVDKSKLMFLSMQNGAGADAAAKIAASSGDVLAYRASVFSLIIQYLIVSLVLFALFFGISSLIIARIKDKKVGFARYIFQYSAVSVAVWLVFLLLSAVLGSVIGGAALSGFSFFTLLKILMIAVLFSLLTYFASALFALIPQASFFSLIKKAYAACFKHPAPKLLSFLIVLIVLLAISLLVKSLAKESPASAVFSLLILFFPYLGLARLFLINSFAK